MSFKKEEELALLEGPSELFKVVQLYLDKKEYDDALRVANETLELARDIEDDDAKEEALEVISRVFLAQDDVEGAIAAAKEAVTFYQEEDDKQGEAQAMSMLASMLMKKGDTKEALQTAKDSISACEECQFGKGKASALAMLARAHGESGDTAEAMRTTQEWLAALKEIDDTQGQGQALNSLVQLHVGRGELEDALPLANEAAQIFKAAGDPKREAAAILMKSKIYTQKKESDWAVRSANEALNLARESEDTEGEVEALYAVMTAQLEKEDITKALDAAAEVLNTFRDGKRDDKRKEASALVTVANLLMKVGDYETALSVAEEARDMLHTQPDSGMDEVTLLLDVTVNAYLMCGSPQLALASAEDAVVLARLMGDNLCEANALQSVARIRMDLGAAEEALQAANEMVAVYSLTNDEVQQAHAQHMVAYIELSKGSSEVALSSAEAALGLFRRAKDRQGEAAVLETLAQIHQAQDKSSEALKASEEALSIYADLGDLAKATAASQSIAGIRFANQEVKEVLREAKLGVSTCQEKKNRHGEAQQHLLIASARLEQASAANPNMDANAERIIPPRRLMEALMAGKDALEIFRESGDLLGEAAALLAVAKVYRFKQEPILAIDWAKQAATAYKKLEDWHSAGSATMLEATTLLTMVGAEISLPDGSGGMQRANAAVEALRAAQDGLALFQASGSPDAEQWAAQVVTTAQDFVDGAKKEAEARAARQTAVPEDEAVVEEVVLPPDDRTDPFEKMGYDFKSQVEIDDFLKRDPRDRGLPLRAFKWAPVRDPIMDRLTVACQQAVR